MWPFSKPDPRPEKYIKVSDTPFDFCEIAFTRTPSSLPSHCYVKAGVARGMQVCPDKYYTVHIYDEAAEWGCYLDHSTKDFDPGLMYVQGMLEYEVVDVNLSNITAYIPAFKNKCIVKENPLYTEWRSRQPIKSILFD